MLTLAKTFEFSASHRLFRPDWSPEKNLEIFGKCANINGHGHNYKLEVSVRGPISSETGMILDARLLHSIVQNRVLADIDHKNLDRDVDWLSGQITSVETIIQGMWDRLAPIIQYEAPPARLARLCLWETSRIFATREEI